MANEFFTQLRPNAGSPAEIYLATTLVKISYLYVTNTSDADIRVSVYIAPQEQSFGRSTALIWREEILSNDFDILLGYRIPLFPGTRVGVWTSASKAATFTVFGEL